jgi:hypothetical protein
MGCQEISKKIYKTDDLKGENALLPNILDKKDKGISIPTHQGIKMLHEV